MKVGDYVRTKRGTFDRFITSHTQDNLTWYTFEDRGNITNPENYIIKSSPNIIDLIEVGDYVNGYKVLEIEKDYLFDYREEINVLIVQNGEVYEVAKKIYSDDIKSIVTREMFESMKYKVGD